MTRHEELAEEQAQWALVVPLIPTLSRRCWAEAAEC